MKKLPLLMLLIMFSMLSLRSQNCDIPQVLIDEYEKDVKHLALFRMEQNNAPELEFVEISEAWQDTIWDGLAAIFNSTSDARDEVFDQYCIHQNSWTSQSYNRISNTMYVSLDPSAPWFQNWENEIITTDDPFLDSLFLQFGVDSIKYSFVSLNVFSLYTDEFLNLNALAQKIETHDEIVYAERVTGAGDGRRISYSYVDGEKFYDFTVGWGDCPAGCTATQTWYFRVDESCNVEFLGIQGNPGIPEPINCNISTSTIFIDENPSIKIFPNPFFDKINIESSLEYSSGKYSLFDINGRKLLEGEIMNDEIRNLNGLNAGIYLLSIEDSNNSITNYKVVKLF